MKLTHSCFTAAFFCLFIDWKKLSQWNLSFWQQGSCQGEEVNGKKTLAHFVCFHVLRPRINILYKCSLYVCQSIPTRQIKSPAIIPLQKSGLMSGETTAPLRQVNLGYYFLESKRQHRGGWNDTKGETGHCFSEIDAIKKTKFMLAHNLENRIYVINKLFLGQVSLITSAPVIYF